MLRYILAAQALRAFSLTPTTKRLYRHIANAIGDRKRSKGLPAHYLSRADNNLRMIESAGLIRDGMSLLEIGTGWTHWESLFTRCFYDVRIMLMDVWDNRQFNAFKSYAAELEQRLGELKRSEEQRQRARSVLSSIRMLESFDDVYARLGFTYVLGAARAYNSVKSDSLDLIFSSDVLEHVPITEIPQMALEHYRMLKPNGASCHQVVPADHLCIYDPRAHPKTYLRFDDRTWNRFFANDVQYVNRMQMSEWIRAFSDAGFEATASVLSTTTLDRTTVSRRFSNLSEADLETTVFYLIGRKSARIQKNT